MGFYQGNGARLITSFTPNASLAHQPACLSDASTGLTDCGNWGISASWAVPANAVSGIYFAHLIRSDTGGDSVIVFVVRDDSSKSAILFQTADETWQAYNDYGGHSVYGSTGFDLTERAYKVSYNRPLQVQNLEVESQVFYAEYPMVRWLEANGYDVSYFSSVDAARSGNLILNHKLYMTAGHDEYTSGPRRTNIEAARDAGVNLALFSGNDMFWKTRWENSIDGSNTPYRTLVCYKETVGPSSNPPGTAVVDPLDPPTWTGTWRDPTKSPPADGGRPENALSGQLFRVNGPGNDNTNLAIKVPAADGKMRFWRNTAVGAQSSGQTWTLPAGTLGYEWDTEEDNGFRPAGLIDLSTATYALTTDYLLDYGGIYGAGTATHHLSLYRASSGALVFGAGTVQWSWGLDATHDNPGTPADRNMQQATVNLLADMGVQPVTLQAGLVLAQPSTDTTPPSSTITSPAQGATVQPFSVVTIAGTATDVGGMVGGVEVSGDAGKTWHPASGRESWTYKWTVAGTGSVTLLSRAVDDSGNMEKPATGTSVTVAQLPFDTIFVSGQVPTSPDAGPDSAVEIGVRFKADVNGTILGVRFYKSVANTGTHVGNLWNSNGTLLASVTFTGETSSGWQQANFSKPVAITAGTVYVASYHTSVGHYSADKNYFANSGVDNPPLHALQDGVSGSDGIFAYGASSNFPTSTFGSANYWVDVAFAPQHTGTLTSIAVTPVNPTIIGGTAQQFTATGTYSDNTSQDISDQVAWSSSNLAVATINSAGLATATAGGTATITASQGSVSAATVLTVKPTVLAISTTSLPAGFAGTPYTFSLAATGGTAPYNWKVTGGTFPAGLTLASNGAITGAPTGAATFTFTVQVSDGGSPTQTANQQLSLTILPASTARSIWSTTTIPTNVDAGPDSPVELGVKFRADVNGKIAGIRFYKATANTGTHVGNLWSSTGALLATATFANETASGWQQVNFSTPVSVIAGTVYIASYHTTLGHYSADLNYFASVGIDNPPLHALQNGVSGANGVYAYGTGGVFPASTFESTNYWVDVAFVPAAPLSSISVTPSNSTIAPGATQQFTATGTFTDNSTQDISSVVTWSSSNGNVASVSTTGMVTGIAGGGSTISATQGSIVGSTSIAVQPTPLVMSTGSLPAGVSGQSYLSILSASGGTVPYSWTVTSGTFPPGLTLSSSGQITGTPSLASTFVFTVTLTDAGSPQQNVSKQLTITILPAGVVNTIWSGSTTPGVVDSGPDGSVELGVTFKSDVGGTILGVRFYKATTNTGTHVANLWTTGGTLLASAVFEGETASGWQQVNFSNPVLISANTLYIASYHSSTGHYSADTNFFALASTDNPPLHAIQDGIGGSNGVYIYGANSSFPSFTSQSTNYWVDVAFLPSATLNSITVAPAAPSIAAGSQQQFTATGTYSDNSTLDITRGVKWSSSTPAVATVSLTGLSTAIAGGSSTITATQGSLTGSAVVNVPVSALGITSSSLPNATVGRPYSATLTALGGSAPYTWSVANGVLPSGLTLSANGQISGTPTSAGTFSFSAQVADGGTPQQSAVQLLSITAAVASPMTIWPSSAVPATVDGGPDSPVELGFKFTSDVNGSILGIRFYKASTNTGTHVANLWSNTGALLATATFSAETASGWQEVDFASPVPISAGVTYIASYHTSVGHYSVTLRGFAAAGVNNPPLHALQNGVSGADGVYSYGSASSFPKLGYQSTNYWVDVVFQ